MGAYDKTLGVWKPELDGIVFKVVGKDTNGLAQVDIGGGRPATSGELASLQFDDDELKVLASKYSDGKSLWRVKIDHFTPYDLNYIGRFVNGLENRADVNIGKVDTKLISNSICPGCEISVEARSMKEFLDISGTNFQLTYSTERVDGNKVESTVVGKLLGDEVPRNLSSILVRVDIAGKTFEKTYPLDPNLDFSYVWDGTDVYGRLIPDGAIAKVQVKYNFRGDYNLLAYQTGSRRFGSTSSTVGLLAPEIKESFFRKEFSIPLKSAKAAAALGKKVANGWFISPHHHYDIKENAIYFGNGKDLLLSSLPQVYQVIAGGGGVGFSGDGGKATGAKLNSPTSVVKAADGSLFIADKGNNRIRKIDIGGIIDTVAGNGLSGYSGDNGPAADATLNAPTSIRVNRDGSFYIVDTGNHCIRLVDEFGTISTFAGVCGQPGFTEDVKSAAFLREPKDIVVGGDGTYYISDSGNHSIRKIQADGHLITLAGNGIAGDDIDEASIGVAQFREPRISDLDMNGNLYVADKGNNVIRRISPDGVVKTLVGLNGGITAKYFLPANQYSVKAPNFAVVKSSGEIYFNDAEMNTVSYLDLNGWVNPLLGYRVSRDPLDFNYATGTTVRFTSIEAMFLNPDGSKIFVDTGANSIATFGPVKPELLNGTYTVPSEDGSEVFVFDSKGKHLRTLFGKTGTVKYNFEYADENNLISITDSFSNKTILQRSGQTLSQIISPFGQITSFSVDQNGFLSTMVNPAGEITTLGYTDLGLLTSFRKPKGNTSTFDYNEVGQLNQENNPAGGFQKITKLDLETNSYQNSAGKSFSVRGVTDEDGYEKDTYIGSRDIYETVYSGATSNIDSDSLYDEATTQYDARSRGITSYVGYKFASTGTGLSDIQTVSREYQFPLGNYFDFILKEHITRGFDGKVTERIYNSQNKSEIVTTPAGRKSMLLIDNFERPINFQLGSLEPVTTKYNTNGLILSSSSGDRETGFSYDNLGRLSRMTDAIGRQFQFGYDGNNRLTSKILPDGRVVGYAYDSNSNVIGVMPPDRSWHEFVFDLLDAVSFYKPPQVSTPNMVTAVNGSDGLVSSRTRADGTVVNFTYDQITRMPAGISTADRSQFIKFLWQDLGTNIKTQFSYDNFQIDYTFDSKLPIRKSYSYSGKFFVNLDNLYGGITGGPFQISAEMIDGSSLSRTYDDDRNLVKVGSFAVLRDQNSQIVSANLGVINELYEHNSFGEITAKRVQKSGSEIYSEIYSRDKISRITQKMVSFQGVSKTTDFEYDLAGRLSSVKTGGNIKNYTYDSQGNRVGSNSLFDAEDKLIQDGDFQFTYSPDGDLSTKLNISNSEVTRYFYDIFGSLKKVNLPDGREIQYITDGENQRAIKLIDGVVQNKYVRNFAGQLAAELTAVNKIKSHFFYLTQSHSPDGMRKDNIYYRFIKDQLGSIRFVINASSGVVEQALEYDEFGVVLSDSNPGFQPFGFAGGQYDPDTKLVRFGARDYDPQLGRWTSKDPILFAGGDTNLYGYVANDPINGIDPSGLKVYDPDGIIPAWIKQTPIYQQLDSALAVILVRNKILEDDFGQTNGIGFGLFQNVDIDVAANAGRSSSTCGKLTGLEDTILHEFNHAKQNLGRYSGAGAENRDNLLLPALLLNSSAYKR